MRDDGSTKDLEAKWWLLLLQEPWPPGLPSSTARPSTRVVGGHPTWMRKNSLVPRTNQFMCGLINSRWPTEQKPSMNIASPRSQIQGACNFIRKQPERKYKWQSSIFWCLIKINYASSAYAVSELLVAAMTNLNGFVVWCLQKGTFCSMRSSPSSKSHPLFPVSLPLT